MERIPCPKCGALILPTTASATGGICMPCKKKEKEDEKAAKRAAIPEMSDAERADLEDKLRDLVRSLKYRDIDSVVAHFHPDERAEAEQMFRHDLDELNESLPDAPEFKWSKANSGLPILDITNSDFTWGIGWACEFKDGRWWFS